MRSNSRASPKSMAKQLRHCRAQRRCLHSRKAYRRSRVLRLSCPRKTEASCCASQSFSRHAIHGAPPVARPPIAAARLDAVAAAKRVHEELGLQSRVTQGLGLVDVFEAITELDIPLVFKPLTSALGLCLPAPLQGIIVTTQRGLHIQRFTAAHELGHVVLNHRGSVDKVILERGPLAPTGGRDLQEVAADAFAAEFLLPRWLYRHHIRSQGWTVAGHLRNPDIVYQLSLRM